MTGPRRGHDRQRGAASVLVLALSAILVAVAALLASLGAVGTARHRAAIVADLAALAAAGRVVDGVDAACLRASGVARAQGAVIRSCRLSGEVAEVTVSVQPPGPLGRLGSARGRARAGPALSAARE